LLIEVGILAVAPDLGDAKARHTQTSQSILHGLKSIRSENGVYFSEVHTLLLDAIDRDAPPYQARDIQFCWDLLPRSPTRTRALLLK